MQVVVSNGTNQLGMCMKLNSAILLSAGHGTRLRPLTLTTPKPLIELANSTLIDHQIKYLANAGFKVIAINLHHLGEKIKEHCGSGKKYGVEIIYSEEKQILGTGGGIKAAAVLIGADRALVLNCDALMSVDIKKLCDSCDENFAATMVLMKLPASEKFNPVKVEDGLVKSFGSGDRLFTGMHIVGKKLLDVLPPAGQASCVIKDGYEKIIARGEPVSAFDYDGYWNDLGTFERYSAAKNDLDEGRFRLM